MLSPEALKAITDSENPEELARRALENAAGKILIELSDLIEKEKERAISPKVVVERTGPRPPAAEIEARVRTINGHESGITAGTLGDFVDYFRSRYEQMSEMLRTRMSNRPIVTLAGLRKKKNEKVRVIAMISEKRGTKNGHLLLQIEDPSGAATALVPSSNQKVMALGNSLVLDGVFALDGRLSKELFIIDDIFSPDVPMKEVRTADEDVAMVTMSDFHIGSRLFMRNNFERFMSWINGDAGDEKQKALAGKVKYITIAGDLVDGIGIYPNQESELDILDIYDQYRAFCEFVERIPEWIQVIIAPGNHDAVKAADPQQALPKELVEPLYSMKNVTLVGSPATVELHGLKTLIYHGTAFDDLIASIPSLSYSRSEEIMDEVLKLRHLHPIYGGKPITPEKRDQLVIKELPDVFHCGHVHKNGYDTYHGVICINSGTWQQVTPYQMKQGHQPTPCILPVLEMNSGKISIIHFDKPA